MEIVIIMGAIILFAVYFVLQMKTVDRTSKKSEANSHTHDNYAWQTDRQIDEMIENINALIDNFQILEERIKDLEKGNNLPSFDYSNLQKSEEFYNRIAAYEDRMSYVEQTITDLHYTVEHLNDIILEEDDDNQQK